jgi:hypothetical protein
LPINLGNAIIEAIRCERGGWWAGGGYVPGLPNTLRAPEYTRIPFGINYVSGYVRQMQQSVFAGFGFNF